MAAIDLYFIANTPSFFWVIPVIPFGKNRLFHIHPLLVYMRYFLFATVFLKKTFDDFQLTKNLLTVIIKNVNGSKKIKVAVYLSVLPGLPTNCGRGESVSTVECWKISKIQKETLQKKLPEADLSFCASEGDFLTALASAEAAITWGFNEEWIKFAPKLKWIATPAAGKDYDSGDNMTIMRTYGTFHGRIIGETVAGMLLGATRGLFQSAAFLSSGKPWPRTDIAPSMRTLRGSNVVILGYGSIGHWIARYLAPFGVAITGIASHSVFQHVETASPIEVSMAPGDALDMLLPSADYLVMALPGNNSTNSIINAERLAELPHDAIVCNVGRGNAIDEDALENALRHGRLRAACLDVFSIEPLPSDSTLRTCPNLFIFPHSSAITPEYLDLFFDEYIELFRRKFI